MGRVNFSQARDEISKKLTTSFYGDKVFNQIASFEQEACMFDANQLNELRTQYSKAVRAYATVYFGIENTQNSRFQHDLDEKQACQEELTKVGGNLRETLTTLKLSQNFIHHHVEDIKRIVKDAIRNAEKEPQNFLPFRTS